MSDDPGFHEGFLRDRPPARTGVGLILRERYEEFIAANAYSDLKPQAESEFVNVTGELARSLAAEMASPFLPFSRAPL